MPRSLVHSPGQTQPNDRPALPLPWLCSAFAYIAIHRPHCHAFAQPTVQAPGRRWLNRSPPPPSRVNCERFHLHQKSVKIFTPCPINYPSPPKFVGESTLLKKYNGYNFVELSYYIIWTITLAIREAPFNESPPLFGHCPNSNYTPPPALKRALWGTFFQARYYHF